MRVAGVRPEAYFLGDSLRGEQYCLVREGSKWVTYYAERGAKNSLREFATEEEACSYFVSWVVRDPTAHAVPSASFKRPDA